MKTSNIALMTNVLMNTNLVSTAVEIQDIYGYAIQAVFTATPTGTFKLQASADPFKYVVGTQPQAPTNWVDVQDSSFAVTSSGVYIWNFNGAFYSFVRLVYTDTSGGSSTARLTVTMNVKGV